MKVTSHLQHIWTKTVSLYLLPPPPFIGWGRCGWTIYYILSYIFSKVLNITINVWLYKKEQFRLLRLTLFLRFTSAPVSKNSIVRVNKAFAIFHIWIKNWFLIKQVLYIPWILRINLFKPTNPKDELV